MDRNKMPIFVYMRAFKLKYVIVKESDLLWSFIIHCSAGDSDIYLFIFKSILYLFLNLTHFNWFSESHWTALLHKHWLIIVSAVVYVYFCAKGVQKSCIFGLAGGHPLICTEYDVCVCSRLAYAYRLCLYKHKLGPGLHIFFQEMNKEIKQLPPWALVIIIHGCHLFHLICNHGGIIDISLLSRSDGITPGGPCLRDCSQVGFARLAWYIVNIVLAVPMIKEFDSLQRSPNSFTLLSRCPIMIIIALSFSFGGFTSIWWTNVLNFVFPYNLR